MQQIKSTNKFKFRKNQSFFKEILALTNLSKIELARSMGLTKQTFHWLMIGKTELRVTHLQSLSKKSGLTIEALCRILVESYGLNASQKKV